MGQQQLLLLVLGIVIVGLAVVAGINAFEENQEKSTKDAIVNEGMRVATDVKAYALKPDQLGGGGGSLPDNLSDAGFETNNGNYDTPWGPITYSSGDSDNNFPGELTLNIDSGSETATIEIPENGSPSLTSGSGGDTWN